MSAQEGESAGEHGGFKLDFKVMVIGAILWMVSQTAFSQAKEPPAQAAPPAPAASAAPSAPLLPPSVELHPWQASPPTLDAQAYFTNLADGQKIETPFRVKFGLSGGWGLAPIAKPIKGKSGHHHLLVDLELPLDINKSLPFSDKYIHFGRGQMETVLNFPPGNYKLRLLLADENHKLHFVYSKPINVTVTKKNDIDPKTLVKPGIEMMVAQGDLPRPFRVQFHASGLSVAHQIQGLNDSGHFRLKMQGVRDGKTAEMVFRNGQTEGWFSPPAGEYALTLELIDNQNPGKVLQSTPPKTIKVP